MTEQSTITNNKDKFIPLVLNRTMEPNFHPEGNVKFWIPEEMIVSVHILTIYFTL